MGGRGASSGAGTKSEAKKLPKEYLKNVKKVLRMEEGTEFIITYEEGKAGFEIGRGEYRGVPDTLGVKMMGIEDVLIPANDKKTIRKLLLNARGSFGNPEKLMVTTPKDREKAKRARQAKFQRQIDETNREIRQIFRE